MLFPAGAEGGGEVAVAGPVDLFDPGAQPVQGFLAFGPFEFPPPRAGSRLVGVVVVVACGVCCPCKPCGEGGDAAGRGLRGFPAALPAAVARSWTASSAVAGLGQLAAQFVELACDLAEVSGLALVEGGEPARRAG